MSEKAALMKLLEEVCVLALDDSRNATRASRVVPDDASLAASKRIRAALEGKRWEIKRLTSEDPDLLFDDDVLVLLARLRGAKDQHDAALAAFEAALPRPVWFAESPTRLRQGVVPMDHPRRYKVETREIIPMTEDMLMAEKHCDATEADAAAVWSCDRSCAVVKVLPFAEDGRRLMCPICRREMAVRYHVQCVMLTPDEDEWE